MYANLFVRCFILWYGNYLVFESKLEGELAAGCCYYGGGKHSPNRHLSLPHAKWEMEFFKGQKCSNHHWRCPFVADGCVEQTKPTNSANRRGKVITVEHFPSIRFVSSVCGFEEGESFDFKRPTHSHTQSLNIWSGKMKEWKNVNITRSVSVCSIFCLARKPNWFFFYTISIICIRTRWYCNYNVTPPPSKVCRRWRGRDAVVIDFKLLFNQIFEIITLYSRLTSHFLRRTVNAGTQKPTKRWKSIIMVPNKKSRTCFHDSDKKLQKAKQNDHREENITIGLSARISSFMRNVCSIHSLFAEKKYSKNYAVRIFQFVVKISGRRRDVWVRLA